MILSFSKMLRRLEHLHCRNAGRTRANMTVAIPHPFNLPIGKVSDAQIMEISAIACKPSPLAMDAVESRLCRSRTGDNTRTRQENYGLMLAFDVNEFFSFGSPLSLILAYRRLLTDHGRFDDAVGVTLHLLTSSRSAVLWTIVQFISCL